MVKDENGKVLAVNDRLKLHFPYEGVCHGVVEGIIVNKGSRRGRGSMIVRTTFEVVFTDTDSVIEGITKLPPLVMGSPPDYAAAKAAGEAARKIVPRGIAKIAKSPRASKAAPSKEKRRA
jgi:hypothetical protein